MAELNPTLSRSLTRRALWQRKLRQAGMTTTGLAVMAVLIAGVVLLPILYLIIRVWSADLSVFELLGEPRVLKTLGRTIGLAVAVTLSCAGIALPVAWLTVRTDLPFRRLWATLTVLPLVIPSYVGAYLMVASLGPRGLLAQWANTALGIEKLPSIYGFPGAVYVLTLLSFPYPLLSLRAALQGMDRSQEEAARSLGETGWGTFRRVTLPQLRPALVAGSLLVTLYVLRDFGAVSIMRYNTFTRVIYVQYQSAFDRSAAAALSLLLAGLTVLLLLGESWTHSRARYYQAGSISGRPPGLIRLGAWRWPATIFCALLVVISLIIPAGVLLFWLIRGWAAGETLAPLWPAARNSLTVSAIAALVCLVAALPVVIVSVRRPGWKSRVLERLTYLGFALPGIVVALALVFFGANYALPLYQTLPMLILAYLILFLPQAIGALRTSLLQVNPNLVEAARSLGRRPARVFVSILLPLIRPGIVAGTSLVFLTVMKELPATLILGPFGFTTLATSVWSAVSEAFFARAAGPALLLVLLSSLPLAFLLIRKET